MNITCKEYSTYEQLRTLKEEFSKSPIDHYEQDFDYLSSLYQHGLVTGKPLTISLSNARGANVIITGSVEHVKYSPTIAYFTLRFIQFKKKCFVVRPYGVLGTMSDPAAARDIEAAVSRYCRANDIDYVYFTLLPKQSIFTQYLLSIRNVLKRDWAAFLEDHFLLEVPERLETFLKNKDAKNRYNIKRIIKQVENTYENNIHIKMFTKAEDVKAFCEDAEAIAEQSHLRPMGVGFKLIPSVLRRQTILAHLGFVRSYVLYLAGKPSAFISGIIYQRRFLTEHIGFDIQHERLSIGTYLLLKVIDDLASSKCADLIDFSYGSDGYKQRFSSLHKEDIRIKLFIPKISNLLFMMTLAFFNAITIVTRKTLQRAGVYSQIRKKVRTMLRNGVNV